MKKKHVSRDKLKSEAKKIISSYGT